MVYATPAKLPYKGIAICKASDGTRLYVIPRRDLLKRGGSIYVGTWIESLRESEATLQRKEKYNA